MRKISRAEEQYNSLNFRTADADEGEKCMSPNGVSYESAAATGGRTTCGRPAVGYGFNKKPTCGGKTCARIEYTHYLGSVKPWGQEEHFRVVDNDTPLTEGGPRCEGCGGKMQEHGSNGSVCRNRACNKRDMVITSAITKNVQENKWKYYPTLSTNNGVSRKETEHCGRCDIVMDESKKSNRPINKTFGKICKDCHDVLKSGE